MHNGKKYTSVFVSKMCFDTKKNDANCHYVCGNSVLIRLRIRKLNISMQLELSSYERYRGKNKLTIITHSSWKRIDDLLSKDDKYMRETLQKSLLYYCEHLQGKQIINSKLDSLIMSNIHKHLPELIQRVKNKHFNKLGL